MNSRGTNESETLYCVYVAIGQKRSTCWGGHVFFSKGEDSEVGEHSAQRANMPAPAPRTC